MFSGSTVTNHPPSTHERLNALAHYYAAAASAFPEIFYHKFTKTFFAELFRKSAVIFPEISGKIPQEISPIANFLGVYQENNFENLSTFGEVTTKSLWCTFLTDSCILNYISRTVWVQIPTASQGLSTTASSIKVPPRGYNLQQWRTNWNGKIGVKNGYIEISGYQ